MPDTVTKDGDSRTARLNSFERECVELFVHAAQALSLPRSIGEIYGFVFSSREPKNLDGVVAALGISKGSASQGLRWLRDVGAVRTVYIAGDRRDHYTAEIELRKLVMGYVRGTLEPHVRNGSGYLERISASIGQLDHSDDRKFSEGRLKKLRRWHRFGTETLPVFLRLAEKF